MARATAAFFEIRRQWSSSPTRLTGKCSFRSMAPLALQNCPLQSRKTFSVPLTQSQKHLLSTTDVFQLQSAPPLRSIDKLWLAKVYRDSCLRQGLGSHVAGYSRDEKLHATSIFDLQPASPPPPSRSKIRRLTDVNIRLFGQILIIFSFKSISTEHGLELLPDGWENWCRFAFDFLRDCSALSPTIAKDVEVASILCDRLGLG